MSKYSKFLGSFVTVTLLTGAIAGCGAKASEGEPSGTVVWYGSTTPELMEETVQEFEDKYPSINVEFMRVVSGELGVRYAQERESGAKTADIITISGSEFIEDGHKKEWWKNDTVAAPGWPEGELVDGVAKTGILPCVITFNTDRVSEAEAPKTWQDTLDSRWKGRLMMGDPRGVPAWLGLLQLWSEEYGDEFLTQLASQDLRYVASMTPGNESLASGAVDVVIPNSVPPTSVAIKNGAPIGIIDVAVTTGTEYKTAVSGNSTNPEATDLFFEFLTSQEGQSVLGGGATSTVRDDVEDALPLPSGYVPLDDLMPKAKEREAELLALMNLS